MGLKVKSSVMRFVAGRRRRPGTVFELPDGAKPTADMKVVEDPPAKAGEVKGKAKGGPGTFSEIARKDGAAQQPKGAQDLV